jgi:hypothetical protein
MSDNNNDNNRFYVHVDSDMYQTSFYLPNMPSPEQFMIRTHKCLDPDKKKLDNNDTDENESEEKIPSNYSHKHSVLAILDEKNVGESLIDLYRDIKHPSHGFIIQDEWRFMSPNEIKKYEKEYTNWIDIAIKYLGCGRVRIIGYIKETDTFFCRKDGGSNYYDRETNFKKIEKLDPRTFKVENGQIEPDVFNNCGSIQYTYYGLMQNIYPEWIM